MSTEHWAVGRYCVIRSSSMGCFGGVVEYVAPPNNDGTLNVVMTECRQLWSWRSAEGVGLAGVAASGLAPNEPRMRIGARVDRIEVCGVGEVVQASDHARKSIEDEPARRNE